MSRNHTIIDRIYAEASTAAGIGNIGGVRDITARRIVPERYGGRYV
ncbi:hypothetical protein SDC9_211570 [bioreactor metagenome]|uniref:Uncharacterized protein n=1 Tax=bioreactor metagenome TaxID=1076179 RepID=A0A645JVT4_9ZZZZ